MCLSSITSLKIFTSSVDIKMWKCLINVGKTFINNFKRIGSRWLLWETSEETWALREIALLHSTNWFRSFKYKWKHSAKLLGNPILRNLYEKVKASLSNDTVADITCVLLSILSEKTTYAHKGKKAFSYLERWPNLPQLHAWLPD